MEEYYQDEMNRILSSITEVTNDTPDNVYDGEHSLRLMIHCIKLDGMMYRLHMKHLLHDNLMVVISHIRDIFPIPDTYHRKRGPIGKELTAIGIPHMAQYVRRHKTDPITYTLDIRQMTYKQCTFVIRSLFSW